MTDVPPTRYRVIERDRRLEVVDLWVKDGRPPGVTAPPPATAPARPGQLRQTRFDGSGELVTQAFYDARGPRTIALDPGSARMIGIARNATLATVVVFILLAFAFPPLWLVLVLAFNGRVRNALRAATTAWLDRVAREAS